MEEEKERGRGEEDTSEGLNTVDKCAFNARIRRNYTFIQFYMFIFFNK